jgi:Domain of unknown function (DUF4864)
MSGLRSRAAMIARSRVPASSRQWAAIAFAVVSGLYSYSWPMRLVQAAEPYAPIEAPVMRPADWTAIKKVIVDQRAALKAGDAAKALSYASAGIRDQFGDAATFIAMVRAGYSALLTARYTEFLEGAVIDGTVVQPLRLVDADNTVRVALYIMQRQENGTWRIGGCQIAPSTVRAT